MFLHCHHTGQQWSEHEYQWTKRPSLQQVVAVVAEVGGSIAHEPGLTQTGAQLSCTQEARIGIRGQLTRPDNSVNKNKRESVFTAGFVCISVVRFLHAVRLCSFRRLVFRRR